MKHISIYILAGVAFALYCALVGLLQRSGIDRATEIDIARNAANRISAVAPHTYSTTASTFGGGGGGGSMYFPSRKATAEEQYEMLRGEKETP